MIERRRYRYVGPEEIRLMPHRTAAADIRAADDLVPWPAGEPVTFIVTVDGTLRIAPRHSEHVACARGEDVLAAGEMTFARNGSGWSAADVSNQSTGYCPDPDSWPAVADALSRAGVRHPGAFTHPVVFRRCVSCGERNIVRDGDFTCALCGAELPARWNVGQ